MSVRVPPAHPKQEHQRVERVAYLKLIKGQITVEEYRQAIAPPVRKRRWRRARG